MRFAHVCLQIRDIEAALSFYQAVGFSITRTPPPRNGVTNVFLSSEGAAEPELQLAWSADAGPGVPSALGHLAVTVAEVGAVVEALAELAVHPDEVVREGREVGSRVAWFSDPDGSSCASKPSNRSSVAAGHRTSTVYL